jgi:hypothetical protein
MILGTDRRAMIARYQQTADFRARLPPGTPTESHPGMTAKMAARRAAEARVEELRRISLQTMEVWNEN